MKLLRTPNRRGQLRACAAIPFVLAAWSGAVPVHGTIADDGGSAFAQDLTKVPSGGVTARRWNVANAPELYAALRASRSGDTILLSPGVYSQIVIRDARFDQLVTIASADPNRPALVRGLKVVNSRGLTFRNLNVTSIGSGDNYAAIRVAQSNNIAFAHLDVYGDASAPPGTQLQGIYAAESNLLTIEQSDFHNLRAALALSRNTDVSVAGNQFHELSKGGVEAAATSQLKVQNNSFYDFATAAGVHGDGIQILTSGTTTIAHDILISGNLVVRGDGTPEQGIFIQDEVGTLPFHNVTIEDNAVIGEQFNGIYLSHATGDVQIRNNVIASWTGANVVRGGNTNYISWLRLGNLGGASVALTGNQAQAFLVGIPSKLFAPPPSNLKLGLIEDQGAALDRQWMATYGASLGTLPLGLAQELGGGARAASTQTLSTPALSTFAAGPYTPTIDALSGVPLQSDSDASDNQGSMGFVKLGAPKLPAIDDRPAIDVGSVKSGAPEPSAWGLMLVGIGALGARLRARRPERPSLQNAERT